MTTKNELFEKIEAQKEKLWEMADFIFDHPEYRGKEYQACDLLTKYLTDNGFSVERSVGGYETSFRAEWKHGEGGPVIGILCEYDALEGLGLVCQALYICTGSRASVHHKRCIQLVETAVLDHITLRTKGFLCRCAINYQCKWLFSCTFL